MLCNLMFFFVKYRYWFASLVDGCHLKNSINKIKYWRREIPRLMCEMQKHLPSTFFNAQEHYLIHQVEEIELCGLVQSRSTWMIERNLKFMKGLVRQQARVEGSMMEGYMIYLNMLNISEYIPNLALKLNLRRICDTNSNNNFEGE